AAYYANAIAEAFVASQNHAHTSATNEAASWLNDRLKTLGDQVKAADDAVAAFKAKHKIIDAGKDSTTRQLRVTELSRQVAAAQLLTEKAKNRYEQARRNLKANVEGPAGSRPDLLSMLRAQRTQLNDQIAQKRAVLGDRHPDLVIAYSQLAELNRQITAERKRSIDTARSDYETLLDQQKALEKQLASLESRMAADVRASVKLQELQRNADASHNIYGQFLSRYKETNAQRQLQTTQVRIVSRATAPIRPTRPALPLILVALVLASLLSACAIVSLIEQARGSVPPTPEAEVRDSRPTQSPEKPAVPVWGRIPNVATSLADKLGWHAAPVRNAEADLRAYLGELLDMVTAAPTGRGKVVLVTSSRPNVGKSSVAQSLNAAALDRGLMSVLIRAEPDSSAGVKSELPAEPAVSDRRQALTATAHSLKLLLGDNPGRQAPSGDVRSEFDLIVIDAPVFGQQDDVPAIAARSDFTVLVMADNVAVPDLLAHAQAAFSRSGNIRLGAIINDPHPANRAERARNGWHPQRSANVA
ncbi:MAG: GumC family protein, partial [Bradyrhizobium sp.]